jgi:hypothetical protein
VEGVFELASKSIKDGFQRRSPELRQRVRRFALRILRDIKLKRNEKLRSGAVRLIVALLPETFAILERLLRDCSSPLWYEVHFTMFSALDRNALEPADQSRVLQLIRQYLLDISSDAGFAAWKAGDILGDEWRNSETAEILGDLLVSARHVSGRKAALHGIEHALNHIPPAEVEKLSALVRKVSRDDRSMEVRRKARLALEGGGCGPPISDTPRGDSARP